MPEPAPDALPELRCSRVSIDHHGQRLDKVLVTLAPEFSRSHLQHLLQAGHVQLEGRVACTSSQRVKAGQRVQLALVPTEESLAFKPQPMALAVLYEDEHLLVLDKPAGLVVHPAPGNWSGTLLNGLLARHADAAKLPRAGIVHRLDKDTSGLMMVGRSLAGVTALVRDIGLRQVHRRYLALVHGQPLRRDFSIDTPIGRDPRVRVRMAVVAGGKPSRTDVHCIGSIDGISALSCTLHSGRTHQIRVHLASLGHPLVADTVYGGQPALGLTRQALHAAELQLAHPLTRRPLSFSAALPADLQEAWRQLGVDA
ncbi:MAG: RluA family pseudouridine synthase [Rubrivivax sp.]